MIGDRAWARHLREDSRAGVVLGVQSVPDGLATGILAGLSPLNGLYGYLVGTIVGAAVTSSAFMVVQGTGAMSMVIADVPLLQSVDDQGPAVATLAVLTGAVMLSAGLLKLGRLLRFVSNAVLVGFMNAVGVNIVLGQLANLTGYAAPGANRIVRSVNTVLSPRELDWRSVAIGVATIALIIVLERTRLKALGLVVAVIVTSAAAALLGWTTVATLDDLGVSLDGLPPLALPAPALVPELVVPAASLAGRREALPEPRRPREPRLDRGLQRPVALRLVQRFHQEVHGTLDALSAWSRVRASRRSTARPMAGGPTVRATSWARVPRTWRARSPGACRSVGQPRRRRSMRRQEHAHGWRR